jgi:hypothetical protein
MIDNLLNSPFFVSLIQILFAAVSLVVAVILYPFGLLIEQTIPALDGALLSIAELLTYIQTYSGWAVNALAIPAVVITMIVGLYTFTVMSTLGVWSVKLLIRWKNAII